MEAESHEQDGGILLRARGERQQHPAILPWLSPSLTNRASFARFRLGSASLPE
jgi:hypothetical protein